MAIEIEMRARFDREAHDRLLSHLARDGEDLGCDDKHIYFYVLPDKLLKVTDNTASGSAKITLKDSKIGQGAAFPETEIAITREDVPAAVRIFNALGFEAEMHEAFNQRRNFRYHGVEIAVKWSEAWGHHAEFEVLLDDSASAAAQEEAVARIRTVAEELDVTLMSEQELAAFTAAFEAAERDRKEQGQRAAHPAPES
ncbi:CYTH domain-containing protein [Streptomyces sp. B1866]|uniref:CYTH domain-containing protein n=1 Tax=Streptomyces sp. B1866 TaxID=3075431 RepID=UPI00289218D5|nr:CYTH domain-containing protein [Streptomyces sp. B1866]MDT3398558.1 CYTH domain-containing protein [Streptomyces sp. B1866]